MPPATVFIRPPGRRPHWRRRRRRRLLPPIPEPRQRRARAFWRPLPMNWTGWARAFLPLPMLRPRCRWRVYRASGHAPAVSCGCLPVCYAAAMFWGRALIRRCRRVNPYRERICASIRWRLARLRYSAPATFRWPFLPPAAIPPRRWRPVARWWLRLIPDIWQPQSRRRRPLCGRWRNAPCPAGCST